MTSSGSGRTLVTVKQAGWRGLPQHPGGVSGLGPRPSLGGPLSKGVAQKRPRTQPWLVRSPDQGVEARRMSSILKEKALRSVRSMSTLGSQFT